MARVHIALVIVRAQPTRAAAHADATNTPVTRCALRNDYLASISAPNFVQAPLAESLKNSISGDTFLGAFYKFTRPHTIRGTMLAAFAGVVKAIG